MKKIRESNLELLRIIAMLMIIILHYLNGDMGGALRVLDKFHINYKIAYFFESASIIAVNLFIIITGYFLISNSKPKLSKAIGIILLAYFYGVILYIASIILNINEFSIIELLKQMNPLLKGNYWFIIMYVILYIISPFINILLNNINKNASISLIIILLFFFSIWPSFLPYGPSNDLGYGIVSFTILYIIGGYIKKYYQCSCKSIKYILIYLICTIITFMFSIFKGTWYPWGYNFIFNVIGAISLFLAFTKMNIKSKIINNIATFTFPIYLIHFNPVVIKVIYKGVLKCEEYYFSKYFTIHMIGSVIAIYFISALIELIRREIVKIFIFITPRKIIRKIKFYIEYIDNAFYTKFYNELDMGKNK